MQLVNEPSVLETLFHIVHPLSQLGQLILKIVTPYLNRPIAFSVGL